MDGGGSEGGKEGGKEGWTDEGRRGSVMAGCREERMLREAARREFIAIITLDGLSEAALHTHCLPPVCVCVRLCVCV